MACAVLAALTLLLVACGGGNDGPSTGAPTMCAAASTATTGSLAALPGDGDGDGDGDSPDCAPPGAPSPGGSGRTASSGGTLAGESQSPVAIGSGCNQQACPAVPVTTPPLSANETEADCPWIDSKTAEDLEGNKVGKTTVLPTDPAGCRFYFAYNLSQMVMQITTQVFADPTDAFNAMVTTAQAGTNAAAVDGIDGDGAVLYQTSFYPGDGPNDWACAFTKGRLLVIVHTNQTTPSTSARNVATAIAPNMPSR
jgi:hypothetical protein